MNVDSRISHIKAELRYKNVSFNYFSKSYDVLNYLIQLECIRGALVFAQILKNASVMLESKEERQGYFKYYNTLDKVILELEKKLEVKNVKIR